MEVASPLTLTAGSTGSKRPLACSPQLLNTPNHAKFAGDNMEMEDSLSRSAKRRRYHADTSVDSLSNAFSAHSTFFGGSAAGTCICRRRRTSCHTALDFIDRARRRPTTRSRRTATSFINHSRFVLLTANALKRNRTASPLLKESSAVEQQQVALIDALKKDKSSLESTLAEVRSDNERLTKENHVLRKAVHIQQDRQNNAEAQLKAAEQYKTETDERMRKMEQMILSLRYHLQAQQPSGNDFMGLRPPDVF